MHLLFLLALALAVLGAFWAFAKLTTLTVVAVALLTAWAAWEMHKMGPRVYASELSGVLSDGGIPQRGVTLSRHVSSWEFKTRQTAVTNDAGEFIFEEVAGRRSFIEYLPLPGTIIVNEWIDIDGGPSERSIWGMSKWNYERNGEIGTPMALICDLSADDTDREAAGREYFGMCRVVDLRSVGRG